MASLSRLVELWRDIPEDEKVRKPRPPVKPKDIVYGVDDRPPALVTWVAAVQHVLIATTVGLFIPTLVLDAAHASHEATLHMTSVCMLALGIGTILSCLNLRDLGGYPPVAPRKTVPQGHLKGRCENPLHHLRDAVMVVCD